MAKMIFVNLPIFDTRVTSGALIALAFDSRAEVDAISEAA